LHRTAYLQGPAIGPVFHKRLESPALTGVGRSGKKEVATALAAARAGAFILPQTSLRFSEGLGPACCRSEGTRARKELTMDRIPITREGYDRLWAEIQRLQQEERPRVIEAIAEARRHGDITENAEFEAAKERQALLEGKINDLYKKLSECEVVEPPKAPPERVVFGSTVALENQDTGEEVRYRLVGPLESDLASGTISVTSPIGRAIIGKEVGDEVQVRAPGGVKRFEIVDISYAV
jgi:transcription elongation factor GreA